MRPVLKYIFCGLVLAALIFISFCVFYIANTYAVNTKNKNKPIFPHYSASYHANLAYPEISEIENIQPPELPPSDGGEISSGSYIDDEPLEEYPETYPNSELFIENETAEIEPQSGIQQESSLASYEIEESGENDSGSYTETELLYNILLTMKINQWIALFVLAVALIIIIFKPIDKSFIG